MGRGREQQRGRGVYKEGERGRGGRGRKREKGGGACLDDRKDNKFVDRKRH